MTYPDIIDLVGQSAATRLAESGITLREIAEYPEEMIRQRTNVPIGAARRLRAALRIGALAVSEVQKSVPVLDNPISVADYVRPSYLGSTVEELRIILLNTRRRPIHFEKVSTGLLDQVLLHSREVFRSAIVHNAHGVILVHNHPSGDPNPSEADIRVTRDLIRSGAVLKIEVLDHVIMGRPTVDRPRDYVSLRELGYFSV